jgi:hypothetical protein
VRYYVGLEACWFAGVRESLESLVADPQVAACELSFAAKFGSSSVLPSRTLLPEGRVRARRRLRRPLLSFSVFIGSPTRIGGGLCANYSSGEDPLLLESELGMYICL